MQTEHNETVSEASKVRVTRRRKAFASVRNPGNVVDAVVVVGAGVSTSSLIWVRWQALSIEVVVAWGVAGIAVLLAGRLFRRRVRGADAILSSVRAFAGGARRNEVLRVAEEFGPLATAYNRLLEDRAATVVPATGGAVEGVARGDAAPSAGLQPALDAMWIGVVVLGPDGAVTALNGAARMLLGLGKREVREIRASDLVRETKASQHCEDVAAGRTRRTESFDVTSETGGTRTHLRVTARPLHGDARGAVVIVEDTTRQRVADEARAALTAHAVHELRTPLTNIRLYVEEALESKDDDTETRGRAINVINHEARRLERVVTDMLSAAEVDGGTLSLQRGDVRLEQLFEELKDDYKAAATGGQISLTFDLPPKFPVISGDRDKLTLLAHNLIGNAIKYTPAGGVVDVRFEEQDQRYVLEVSDTGIGISSEECELVFDRFYRSRDARVAAITGTGLGLTLAREVARLHGGDITVDSQPDQGSRFTAWLPREERAAAA